jgi:hypothetical protein
VSEPSSANFQPPALRGELPPSADKPRDLRRLESDFPGIQMDPDVTAIFHDPNTGKVEVWSVDVAVYDPKVYLLGGEEDYDIRVSRTTEQSKATPAVDRRHYEVIGIIRQP